MPGEKLSAVEGKSPPVHFCSASGKGKEENAAPRPGRAAQAVQPHCSHHKLWYPDNPTSRPNTAWHMNHTGDLPGSQDLASDLLRWYRSDQSIGGLLSAAGLGWCWCGVSCTSGVEGPALGPVISCQPRPPAAAGRTAGKARSCHTATGFRHASAAQ